MSNNPKSKSIEQLMAEADELMKQINSDVVTDMKEEHRLQFEKHAQNFKKIQSGIQTQSGEKDTPKISSSAEGMHEAIQDIVNAFQDLKNKIF